MKIRRNFPGLAFVCLAIASGATMFAQKTVAQIMPADKIIPVTLVSRAGLQGVTFDPPEGRITVYLPDDIAAGDTISGTVVAEPKGGTEFERTENQARLGDYRVELRIASSASTAGLNVAIPLSDSSTRRRLEFNTTFPRASDRSGPIVNPWLVSKDGEWIGVMARAGSQGGEGYRFRIDNTPRVSVTSVPTANQFQLPGIGQQGRSIEIVGPFDGNSSNTTLYFRSAGSTVQDSEKGTENVSGGFAVHRPLAESPRKTVFEAPTNVAGRLELILNEGKTQTSSEYRNVGVHLSATKTNLLRGESTTLTVEVRGLEGITQNVPLQLDTRGVITMDGGNFQNLQISPTEVNAEGSYATTRSITGQQSGGFNVTATVIVAPFDVCLQDDTNPASRIVINSFTGAYSFQCGGPSCPSSQRRLVVTEGSSGQGETSKGSNTNQPPNISPATSTGNLSNARSLGGTGKVALKGCILTLQHNAPGRRVSATFDMCNKTGNAAVETSTPKATITITDGNPWGASCPLPSL